METGTPKKNVVPPLPAPRRRISLTPPRAVYGVTNELEVPILPERDAAASVGSAALQGASAASADLMFDRMAEICARIADGQYNSDEILDAVARRIVESGALRPKAMRCGT